MKDENGGTSQLSSKRKTIENKKGKDKRKNKKQK